MSSSTPSYWIDSDLKFLLHYMSNNLDVKQTTRIMISYLKHEVLYRFIEEFKPVSDTADSIRNDYVREMFNRTIIQDQVNYSIRLQYDFEVALCNMANECVSTLLDTMNRNVYPHFMEIKWQILKKFTPYMNYSQIDPLV